MLFSSSLAPALNARRDLSSTAFACRRAVGIASRQLTDRANLGVNARTLSCYRRRFATKKKHTGDSYAWFSLEFLYRFTSSDYH